MSVRKTLAKTMQLAIIIMYGQKRNITANAFLDGQERTVMLVGFISCIILKGLAIRGNFVVFRIGLSLWLIVLG